MLKMSTEIETIVNTYKTLSKIPSIAGARLNNDGTKITAKFSVRNLDKGKSTKYVYNYILDDALKVVSKSEFGTDVSNELLSAVSPRETFRAVIREEKEKDTKKQYLEVWSRATLAHSVDLTALDLHGDVYADSEFGCLDWSPDESSLVYVAEKKLKKSEPYIKRKSEDKNKPDGSGEALPKNGEEYLYRQDWGEQLGGKILSVIVVCKIDSETFTVLEGLPESWCPGQVRFTADGGSVVGAAWETEPRRLGLIFCTNRPGYIFQLTLDGKLTKLSEQGSAVRSPRVLGAATAWLSRTSGGPHHACHALVLRNGDESSPSTLINIVDRQQTTENKSTFYGIYSQSLPDSCFSEDGKRIVFSSPQQNEVRSYVVDIDSGRLVDISLRQPGSTSVLDVKADVILAAYSNITTPGQLYAARLPSRGQEGDIAWVRVSEPIDVPPSLATATVEYLDLEHQGSSDDVKSLSALYIAPKAEQKLPLIVWPHGGPHSNFVNAFSLETALFNLLGFACVQVNYRGSSGSGQASIQFLPSRVGDADVKDCKLATDAVTKRYNIDESKIGLMGGSHGGFLVAHLSGQYPDTYAAVVSRNPVIDVASMFNSSDIPDCGDATVRSLIGQVGTYDVADCHLALTTVLERDTRTQRENVMLYAGSYGGFLATHMAGQYPDTFRAMVLRNPLIDLATKGSYADNSDGCAIEAGYPFTEQGPVSEPELLSMRRCSPLVHAHRVKAPTALMLGSGDKRVPHYQGLEFARRLKANGVPTRIYMYDDNHSLSSLPNEMDNLINGASWFLGHLQA